MKYRVDGVKVVVVEDERIVAGSVNIHNAEFEFDSSWSEYTSILAVFQNGNMVIEQLVIDNKCQIPWEVLENSGYLNVGVRGLTSRKKRPTLWAPQKFVTDGTKPGSPPREPTPDIYQQLLAMLEGLGGADEDDVKKIVEEYLTENPPSAKESDPTVPDWAKTPEKPKYSASEVGAISTDDLQSAVNTALSKAKESGEFDGDGGDNGITPHIGENGNWYLGQEDTGIKARGYTPQKGIDYFDGEPGYTPQKGVDYFDGQPGQTPHIGANGNWHIGDTDTGVKARGADGKDGDNYILTEADKENIALLVLGILPEESEVYTGTEEPTDPNVKIWVNPEETPKIATKDYVDNAVNEAMSNGDKENDTDNSIPDYWLPALEEGAKSINQVLSTVGCDKSAFLFYSDAHWNYGSQISPKLLKALYKYTGMTKTFFGGDIVNDEVSDYDAMSYLWDWRKMLKDLPNHHSVVGNHDDGNSTDNLFSEQYVYSYLLSAEETPDVVRGKGGMYYYIDHSPEKTRYIFLDTAYQGMNSAQIAFLKQALKETPESWHIVAIAHSWYYADYNQYDVRPIPIGGMDSNAETVVSMLDAYNSRTGEYADCTGWVEFCIGGHVHRDYDGVTSTGIPIILVETDSQHTRGSYTYTAGTDTEASVNGIIADYSKHKIHVIRIGRGESRVIEVTNYVVSYTNVLPLSLAADGVSVYNAGETPGYKADTRWSQSGQCESESIGTYITGWIPVSPGDVIRLANMTTQSSNFLLLISSTPGKTNGSNTYDEIISWSKTPTDESGNIIELAIPTNFSYQYIRISCGGISAASVITINEPIE